VQNPEDTTTGLLSYENNCADRNIIPYSRSKFV